MTAALQAMLESLQPQLVEGRFAFCRLASGSALPAAAVGWFREAEGDTVILPSDAAVAAGLAVEFEAAWIALGLESSLDAVGLTAAVAAALAEEGIGCNAVAACRHDHLFVPFHRAADALRALHKLAARRPHGNLAAPTPNPLE